MLLSYIQHARRYKLLSLRTTYKKIVTRHMTPIYLISTNSVTDVYVIENHNFFIRTILSVYIILFIIIYIDMPCCYIGEVKGISFYSSEALRQLRNSS